MTKQNLKLDYENIFVPPFYTIPYAENYSPHSERNVPSFLPNCCSFHKESLRNLEEIFAEFYPNFSNVEKKMYDWYLTSEYKSLSRKIVIQVSYTEYFIKININGTDWLKKILYYMDYNYLSFGIPQLGVVHYASLLKYYLVFIQKDIPKQKQELLIKTLDEFIDSCAKEADKNETADMDLIHSVFQKWLKIFPFDIEVFNSFKKEYENIWYIYEDVNEVNPYSGKRYVKSITKTKLFEILSITTKNLLKLCNASDLIENGYTGTYLSEYKLGIIKEKHKLKQQKLLYDYTKEELNYIHILEVWYENEKEFLNEFTSLAEPDNTVKSSKPEFQNLKTFQLNFSKRQLETFKVLLISGQFISDISDYDFFYLFKQNPIIPSMVRLHWKNSKSKCHYLLSKTIFAETQFDFNQVNKCIMFNDGKLLDSNSKSGEYIEIDDILNKLKGIK